jgi:polysaccharide deacetylase family protein (PEP-CTERM system associated)
MSTSKKLIFTFDLEDHLGRYDSTSRYSAISREILELLSQNQIRGTVFVVGKIAETEPTLLREIAALGHELACHSLDHVPLTQQSPDQFLDDTRRAKHLIEDCIGKPIIGFRAPIFSLTKSTLWATDILAALGFRYSSSIMPAHNPLYSFPHAPKTPFMWGNGLAEIPCPVARLGPLTLPYLGGFYLRYLPQRLVRHCIEQADMASCLWTYCHPYDFDATEPFQRIQGAALWTSLLLWFNRRNTSRKVLDLVRGNGNTTLADWLSENSGSLRPIHAMDTVAPTAQ